MDILRRIDLQLFGDGDGGGSDGGDPGESTVQNHGEKATGGPGGPKTYSEDYVRALRGEAAGYRTQLRQLEGVLETVKQYLGVKGDVQDWKQTLEAHKQAHQRAIEEATSKARDMLVKAEIRAQAAELGIVDADAAAKLADLSGVKVGDDGTVEGVREALEALLEAKPYLKAAPKQVGSPSNPPGAATGERNPWLKEHFNLTEQGRILREDPAKAQRMMAEAGIKR